MALKIIIHKADERGFWAEVPSLPGCVSQGETMEEVQANISEATKLWIETGDDISYVEDGADVMEQNG